MKYIILILFLLMGISAKSQTVGDSFTYIREREVGSFNTSGEREYPYYYSVYSEDVQSDIVYLFNKELICIYMIIQPKTPYFADIWCDSFNNKWESYTENNWVYMKEDGTILVCELKIKYNTEYLYDNDIYIFYIHEMK